MIPRKKPVNSDPERPYRSIYLQFAAVIAFIAVGTAMLIVLKVDPITVRVIVSGIMLLGSLFFGISHADTRNQTLKNAFVGIFATIMLLATIVIFTIAMHQHSNNLYIIGTLCTLALCYMVILRSKNYERWHTEYQNKKLKAESRLSDDYKHYLDTHDPDTKNL